MQINLTIGSHTFTRTHYSKHIKHVTQSYARTHMHMRLKWNFNFKIRLSAFLSGECYFFGFVCFCFYYNDSVYGFRASVRSQSNGRNTGSAPKKKTNDQILSIKSLKCHRNHKSRLDFLYVYCFPCCFCCCCCLQINSCKKEYKFYSQSKLIILEL